MNYYIQGNKEKADQIKAAFEELGVASNANRYNYKNDHVLYFSAGGMMHMVDANGSWANIIKTHPDYKELELPVEPKFKKGDWIACDADSFTLSIKSVKDGNYYFHQGASLPIKDIDEHYHLWTIADAKDGDVLCTYECGEPKIVFIYKNGTDVFMYYCFYNIMYPRFDANNEPGCLATKREDVKPATKEQRDLLFAKMKEAGYQWNVDNKELRKVQPHYDIKNFHAGMPVLVRDYDDGQWSYAQFSHYVEECRMKFNACGIPYIQCIPFNDDTKHLLGTTDMPSEEFINW